MNNIRDTCGVLVFSDEKQVSDCAKSVQYKRTSAFTPAIIAFFVTFFITLTIAQNYFTGAADKVGNKSISPTGAALIFIGTALVTYLAYNWGYDSADGSDLRVLYNADQAELKSREVNFPGNMQGNINDLISDRQNQRQAYAMGRHTGYNNRYNRNDNVSFNGIGLNNGRLSFSI